MNATADYQLTIIVPVYNEREGLPALEERLAAYLPKCPVKACVLLVNDGSTDGSAAGILEACSRHTDFFYLEFERNHGLSTALKAVENWQFALVNEVPGAAVVSAAFSALKENPRDSPAYGPILLPEPLSDVANTA